MVLQQCLPGKVVPHHCQLLSDKEQGDGECGPYLLIKQLKTLALWVTLRKSYPWVGKSLTGKGVNNVRFPCSSWVVSWLQDVLCYRDCGILASALVSTQGLNNLTLQGSFNSLPSLCHSGHWSRHFQFCFVLFFYPHLHKLRLAEGEGSLMWGLKIPLKNWSIFKGDLRA